jgi:hypothetical protein
MAEDPVEVAIAEVAERFPEWEPTPAMLGFARAVGAALLDNKAGGLWYRRWFKAQQELGR